VELSLGRALEPSSLVGNGVRRSEITDVHVLGTSAYSRHRPILAPSVVDGIPGNRCLRFIDRAGQHTFDGR